MGNIIKRLSTASRKELFKQLGIVMLAAVGLTLFISFADSITLLLFKLLGGLVK